MGCCTSGGETIDPETKKQNEKVSKDLEKDAQKSKEKIKLLFLGIGGSGKTTLFRQLRNIHGNGFSEGDREQFRIEMYEQIIDAMKLMINRLEEWQEEYPDSKENYEISSSNKDAADMILSSKNLQNLDPTTVSYLKQLWADPAIQAAYKKRNRLFIPESTGPFLNRLDEISEANYQVTDNDLLLVSHRTTGMTEKEFLIDGQPFTICDVGGQRNERRKWIHHFDNVAGVLFVTSLSHYDENIFEDENANALEESLEVFYEHVNSRYFLKTAFILFLNKSDLFKEKIKQVPLTVCFKDYKGDPNSYDEGIEFIKGKFEEQNDNKEQRKIYSHVTCATDKALIENVFKDVSNIISDMHKKGSLAY